jgi:hypothetical protein
MKKEHVLGLVAICLVIVVLSVSGLASDVLTRLDLDLDGLLLIMVSLLMAGLFLLMLLLIAKDQGWLPAGHKKESAAVAAPGAKAAPAPAAAARPAAAKPQPEVPVSVRPGEGK